MVDGVVGGDGRDGGEQWINVLSQCLESPLGLPDGGLELMLLLLEVVDLELDVL